MSGEFSSRIQQQNARAWRWRSLTSNEEAVHGCPTADGSTSVSVCVRVTSPSSSMLSRTSSICGILEFAHLVSLCVVVIGGGMSGHEGSPLDGLQTMPAWVTSLFDRWRARVFQADRETASKRARS